ncbi:hypothetical protein PR003_g8182 [Phytophthora rubi]|nr:hypothetical protein PR002_g13925 [Phytophthora rubi]KAE9344984.1 hypothetical protein PR003_g8182 [Phytophthora rubi]
MEKIPLPPNYFAMDDLVKMTKDWNFKIDKFEEWYLKQFSVAHIREELNLKRNPGFESILLDYINLYFEVQGKGRQTTTPHC